ncbi:MAG: PD-(D/E)XK nuclease domain-containing protein, partial [bacterium]
PFDVLLYLDEKVFKNYWYETGTPSFIIDLIKEKKYDITKLENIVMDEGMLNKFDIEYSNIEALMFQSGYLTIKEYKQTLYGISYKLGFPNKEVEISFNRDILTIMIEKTEKIRNISDKLIEIFEKEKIQELKGEIETLISSISYMYLKEEYSYVIAVYSMLYASGLNVILEDNTSKGRIDLTIIVNKRIVYIIEFKVIENEQEKGKALKQIKEKEYYKKYLNYEKIYLVGIEFDKNTKNITNFEYEIFK